MLNLLTKIVLGPERADAGRAATVEAADERRHADDRGDADDDAEDGQRRAQLVGAQRVERHPDDFAGQRLYSRRSASIGSRRRPATPGRAPKNSPTPAVMPMPEHDRPRLEPRRQRRHRGRSPARRANPSDDADDAAEGRQRDRLGEHLRHDVAPPRAERLAQADLARALADHHQHDVHDDDAADDAATAPPRRPARRRCRSSPAGRGRGTCRT